MEHGSIEHRLLADIAARHNLKNEVERKKSLIAKLTKDRECTKKKRMSNRCSATIKRLNAEIKQFEYKLNRRNMDLQRRIMSELEFSEEEIQNFTRQYQKEYSEMVEIEDKLEAIEEGTVEPAAEETPGEEVPSKEAIVARTKRILGKERKIVERIQREIGSEKRDRVVFANELQQIVTELEAYAQN